MLKSTHICVWCNTKFKCKKTKNLKYCYCIQLISNKLIFYCSDECERAENSPTDDEYEDALIIIN
jgi:hypothetical protein